jgi:hypothetical protein
LLNKNYNSKMAMREQNRTGRSDNQNWTDRTGQAERYMQKLTRRTGKAEQDIQNGTSRTGLSEKDRQNRAGRTLTGRAVC